MHILWMGTIDLKLLHGCKRIECKGVNGDIGKIIDIYREIYNKKRIL